MPLRVLRGYSAQVVERLLLSRLRLEARIFDLRHSTVTGGRIPAPKLNLPPGGRAYQSVNERNFHTALRNAAITGGAFVDLGAGKGKSMLMASHYPFARIVGVEYSERTGCTTPMEVRQGDAATYEFEHDETMVFLYNPFDAPVLGRVMENLGRSLATHQRPVTVVYHNPQHEEVLRRFPGLHPVTRVNSRLRGCDTAIYCTMFAP
jgi:hypothetical protein